MSGTLKLLACILLLATASSRGQQKGTIDPAKVAALKSEAVAGVQSRTKLAQVMVDTVYS